MSKIDPVIIIGGGLAGSEAAWQLAIHKIPSIIYEMRPKRMTEAHPVSYTHLRAHET